ncbi:MAG: Ig-like domain-containing protein [Prevotella sp.]|nr:Ig-like domain-containing protein [Prevotella sp.]
MNDGDDAGFTIGEATMHYLGDYEEQGFTWNKRFAYEFVEGRGKFTFRNKNNKKDKNCGMFSWDFAHYFSILDLKDGDKVTITIPTGTVTFVSETAEGVAEGDAVVSDQTYTIATTEATTRLDIQMAAATLIAKIVIEPAGEETIPMITLTQKTLKLVPGATAKLAANVDPAGFATQWKSSDEQVATVDADGTVTAVAAGTATITNYWNSEVSEATASDACEVTVADVDLTKLTVANEYDFEAMGDVTLELAGEPAGAIWNEANSKVNDVFFCTNEGLELLAVQAAAAANGKGWSIVEGQGLFLGTGAGRCAAIAGITKGQIVEFIYTGEGFYTRSDDDGIEKEALNEGVGRAIYQATEDGMIGFELVKGNAVKKITIYDTAAEEPEVVTFDFNAYEGPVSTNDSNDGDINGAYYDTVGDVTLVVTGATADAKTPNRFWGTNKGPQLRMYSAYFALVAADGKAIVKVVINQGKWNAGNTFNGVASATSEWEGNSQDVEVSIAGNTQMNSIEVTLADANDDTTSFDLDNPTLGISTIEPQRADSNVIYNLQGQQVKNAQKGLFIINGKKVVR